MASWLDIEKLLIDFQRQASSNEDKRAKALTLTKLEEASFWASKIELGSNVSTRG